MCLIQGLAANLEETMKTVPLVNKLVSPFLYSIVSGALIAHGHNLFLKTTPRQLLQGHHINIFETASEMVKPFSVFGLKEEDLLPTKDLPNNAFGILNGKNATPVGPFEINTGLYDQSRYTYMVSYKGQKRMNKWGTDYCNRIFGTDGAQFPPFRSKRDKLPIFTADLCRTLYVMFDQESEFKGIPVWRLRLDPKLFETPAMNPDNECYCAHWRKRPDRCSVRGVMDLAGCLNAPLVLSAPHFMGTEPNLANLVEGLEPSKKKHEFFMYFEPRLGLPVFAYARLQMSIRVERTAFLRGFDKIRNAYIPLVWIEESGGLDDFLGTVLKIILVYIIDGSVAFAWLLMILGWGMAIICFFYGVFWTGRRLDSEERLYSVTDSKDQSKAHLANAAADHTDEETDQDGDIDDDSGDSNTSESSALNKKITDLNLRASAPSLEKRSPSSPMGALKHTYVPVYRKTTTTIVQSHHQQHHNTRSSSYKNIRNSTSDTSPIVVYRPTSTSTTTSPTTPIKTLRPLSSASAKSLPRIRDLDEIRTSVGPSTSPILVPLVDKNAL